MKSKITVEVDFNNNNLPVLRILQSDSDDVRDKLVSSFLQSLGHTSRWAVIAYDGEVGVSYPGSDQTHRWFIRPITPQEIESEISLMQAVLRKDDVAAPKSDFKPILVECGVQRRYRLDLNSPTELAIRDAMKKVEEVGAHPILTEAIMKLDDAFQLVADYEDGRR